MAPLVVKFEDKYSPKATTSKEQKKVLRSGKPVSLAQLKAKKLLAQKQKIREAKTKEDADDVKNDLDLQRLLDESHILADNSLMPRYSGAQLSLDDEAGITGSARVRTLDSRIGHLAEANASSRRGKGRKKLEKMSMNMRKGMVNAHMRRVEKYEAEARDAGTVLSRTKKGEFRRIGDSGTTSFTERIGSGMKQKKSRVRDRGLKINSVGRASDSGIHLSKKDLDTIRGNPKQRGGRGRKGRY